MYNRYIPSGEDYIPVEQPKQRGTPRQHAEASRRSVGREERPGGLSGLLKGLGDLDLDSGDLLILLIILFLIKDGENTELAITLALVLLLGLGEEKKERREEDCGG